MEHVVALTLAYLLGSIPFAFLLARRRGIDLRDVGSGNVGASNVLRTSGTRAAVLAMLLDAMKGAVAVIVAQRLAPGPTTPMAAGLASVVGHIYPVWLRFRGGKGVATACGVFWILAPLATAMASVIFIGAVWSTRYVSLGSVIATAVLPTFLWITNSTAAVIVGGVAAAVLVIERHRPNLARLREGTERRLGQRA